MPHIRPGVVDLFDGTDPGEFYVCQIPDSREVERWVRSPDAKDPHKRSAHWCAMCCVRMILLAERRRPVYSLTELFDAASDCRAYMIQEPQEGWRGAYHRELVDFLHFSCGLRAFAERGMDTRFVLERLRDGFYCMLSVHPDIRLRSKEPTPHKGGHFVLVYGAERDSKYGDRFLVNNSAGFASEGSQIGMRVPFARMDQVFSGNGLIIQSRFYTPPFPNFMG